MGLAWQIDGVPRRPLNLASRALAVTCVLASLSTLARSLAHSHTAREYSLPGPQGDSAVAPNTPIATLYDVMGMSHQLVDKVGRLTFASELTMRVDRVRARPKELLSSRIKAPARMSCGSAGWLAGRQLPLVTRCLSCKLVLLWPLPP